MVRKKLATAILAISAMQAGWVSALGLGEATLKSSLNQPLVAEIYINDIGDLSADQLVVKMASADDFNRAGVERAFFLTGIKFDVRMDGRGGGVVRLITREPVNEPYLNFVIEARWPSGRMLREYTLLLDLPVFSQGGTGAIDSATTSAVGAAVELADQAPETAVAPAPRRVQPVRSYQPAGDGQHRVESNETLWRIASNNRPDGASVQQTVVAIHRMNPEAFANGNMNVLKVGSVLRLPTAADVEAIGNSDAAVEISRSSNNSDEAAPVERGPDLDARASEETAPAPVKEESRLSIATPGESSSEGSADAESSKALRNELGAAQENLDRVQREKAELEGRVDEMERQMGTLQKILQLKEEQLSALQSQAEQTNTAAESAPASASAPAPAPAPATATATAPAPAPATESAAPAETTAEAPVAPVAQPAPAEPAPVAQTPAKDVQPKPAAPKAGLMAQVMENSVALIGVAVAGFVAIAVMMSRRRKQAAEEREVESLLASENFTAEPAVAAALASVQNVEAPAVVDAPIEETPVTEQPAGKTTSETGDPIAEADIYVAYGRYPQAIDLLQGAIRNEPANSEYQVKLLEVYLETQDKAGFQSQFAQLQSLGDYAAIGRVKELMSAFDGVEGWLDTTDLIQDDDTGFDTAITNTYVADEELLAKGSASNDFSAELELPEDAGLSLELDDDSAFKSADNGLELDLADFEKDTDSSLTLDNELSLENELSLDNELTLDSELALDSENDFASNLSLDDELTGAEMAEAEELSLVEEAEAGNEIVSLDHSTAPSFDNGFADDLEHSLETESLADDTDLSFAGSLESDLESGARELGELDELDQALSELGSDTDLASLDNEFGDLLNETSASDLALSESELSIEMPTELTDDLPDTLDFSNTEELAAFEQNDAALDADLDLSDLGDLDGGLDVSTNDVADTVPQDAAPEVTVSEVTAETLAVDAENAPSADGEEFDFADSDEVATKLDLARAYIDMGDTDGAREILDEVVAEGNDEQKGQASDLLARIA